LAAEREQARERRRLAAVARDERTCTPDEKAVVDDGGAPPRGCAAYAAKQAQESSSASSSSSSPCDPSYRGACLDPNAADYDCANGSGNGPEYVHGPVQVVGDDHYDLDRNNNGVGCEEG
jgi:hypothetical protein